CQLKSYAPGPLSSMISCSLSFDVLADRTNRIRILLQMRTFLDEANEMLGSGLQREFNCFHKNHSRVLANRHETLLVLPSYWVKGGNFEAVQSVTSHARGTQETCVN